MPKCHRETIAEGTEMVIWKITETESELQQGLSLSKKALERLSQRNSSVHRKGYLAIRQLLKSLEISPEIHQYDGTGAPYLTDGRFISISHAKDIAAVAISSTKVGIDLEYYQNKIKKIGVRFLHASERETPHSMEEVAYLTQIWTAKEALYKLMKIPGIIFNENLQIQSFENRSLQGIGIVIDQGKKIMHQLHFRQFENYCLTLATTK